MTSSRARVQTVASGPIRSEVSLTGSQTVVSPTPYDPLTARRLPDGDDVDGRGPLGHRMSLLTGVAEPSDADKASLYGTLSEVMATTRL